MTMADAQERTVRADDPSPRARDEGSHLVDLQQQDGCWEGELVWNQMIVAQYVILRVVIGRGVDERTRRGVLRHFAVTQLPSGAWGMHAESGGYVFFTALTYVALRILGVPADDPMAASARRWLHAQPEGVRAIPTWGKYWLAFLDLYGYEGVNPCPPELFLLPEGMPLHPRRYYCHTRNIYLVLSFLYGSRFVARTPITAELRRELYGAAYASIRFEEDRHRLAESDTYVPPGPGLRLTMDALYRYEGVRSEKLRRRALDFCFERIVYEQEQTRYQGISPVNGILNCFALYARGREEGREHPALSPSIEGIEAWRWEDEAEGVRFAGARSQTWDTAFAMQALLASKSRSARAQSALRRGYRYLLGAQTTVEHPRYAEEYRDISLGGWCVSDGRHGWPVSDCTAEALCALLALHRSKDAALPAGERITAPRLARAAEFMLSRQNPDGGFGSYERRRAGRFLESLNPTEMFGSCMAEGSYVECTASCLAALAHLVQDEPGALSADLRRRVDRAIPRAVAFLRKSQLRDGTFPAFWGIYVTYAIFHVVKGLRAAGITEGDPLLLRAAAWLVEHQKADGGWGEHVRSAVEGRYVEHPESQAVMTSFAVLSLLEILGPRADAVERGIAFLRARQAADGSFPPEAPNGVFFGSAAIDYRLYRGYFPVWALGRYEALRG